MRRYRHRVPWVVAGAVAMIASLVVVASASATVTPTVVRATPAFEWLPVHNGPYLAWTQRPTADSPASSNRVWVKVDGGAPFRVTNTQSNTGDISGNILVFQQIVDGRSSIRFYDLFTRTFLSTPAEMNLNGTERNPSMVGDMATGWVEFSRVVKAGQRVILFNMDNHHQITLATSTSVDAGQVNTDPDLDSAYPLYASYKVCGQTNGCDVVSYGFTASDPTHGARSSVHSIKNQLGPGVSDDGTTYYISRPVGTSCGSADMRSFDWGASKSSLVFSLPAGMDSFHTYVDRTPSSEPPGDNVYFDQRTCGGDSDLWQLVNPAQ